jgi:hypothetical protein
MPRARFRTDLRLWLLAAGGVFVALGFVDPVAGVAKGDNGLWAYVARFVTGDYFCSTPDIVIPILFRSALQAVPAAALGWVVQAVVVVARGPAEVADAEPGAAADRRGM